MFDAYGRRAWLTPAALLLAPAALVVIAAVPTEPWWWSRFVALIGVCNPWVLPTNFVRDRGKEVEPQLWQSWGGEPVVQLMRWAAASNPVAHARLHSAITAATGLALPTAEEEASDPRKADHIYGAASTELRVRTRNAAQFGLLAQELADYGMRRNLLGVRHVGRVIALMSSAVAAAIGILVMVTDVPGEVWLMGVVAVANASASLAWARLVTPSFVRPAATRYAERLVEASHTLAEANR